MSDADFRSLFNQMRSRWRLTNEEIAGELGVSSKTVSAWKLGYADPTGETRRKIVVYAARFDRAVAIAMAHAIGIGRETGILLDSHGAHGPELDPHAVGGELFVVAEQLKISPRDLTLAVSGLVGLWSSRGTSLPQLNVALEKLKTVVK